MAKNFKDIKEYIKNEDKQKNNLHIYDDNDIAFLHYARCICKKV